MDCKPGKRTDLNRMCEDMLPGSSSSELRQKYGMSSLLHVRSVSICFQHEEDDKIMESLRQEMLAADLRPRQRQTVGTFFPLK